MYLYGSTSANIDKILFEIESNIQCFPSFGFSIDIVRRHSENYFDWIEVECTSSLSDSEIRERLLVYLLTSCLNSSQPLAI